MGDSICQTLILVTMVTAVFAGAPVEGFQCYTCSYTISTDPSVDYDCVTEPWNVTKGMVTLSCTVPYMCITRASYSQDMGHIRSVTRSCLPQQESCAGPDCCNKGDTYPLCEFKCRADLCNADNPARRLVTAGPDSGDDSTNDRGAAASTSHHPVWAFVFMFMSVLLQHHLH